MKKFALIVAGGSGSRMKSETPKQFIEFAGLPVLMHTFNAFKNYDSEIEFILVLPSSQITSWKNLCETYNFKLNHKTVAGGNTRFQSVKNGLDSISEEGIVFIHDGVRPLVSGKTIDNCFETALKKGNALPVISLSESIRFNDKNRNKTVDRNKYFLVQTPQTFKTELIKKAYLQEYSDSFTDDASVLESEGGIINLVEGNRQNIKITFPEDLVIAEAIQNMSNLY